MTLSSAAEKHLIRRLKRRDEAAFNEIVKRYQLKVYNLVLRMIGNPAEAEDLAQEVFITVFRAIDRFRGESKFSTWLYRVTVNHCKNRLKYLGRRGHHRTQSIDDMHEQDFGAPLKRSVDHPDQILMGYELERAIKQAIGELNEEHRVLIILRDIESLTYQEIAGIVDLPVGTVKSRLHRARLALKKRMDRLRR